MTHTPDPNAITQRTEKLVNTLIPAHRAEAREEIRQMLTESCGMVVDHYHTTQRRQRTFMHLTTDIPTGTVKEQHHQHGPDDTCECDL